MGICNKVFVLLIDLGVYKGKYFHINPRVSCYLLSRSLVKQGEGREQEIKTRKICPNKRMNSWFIPYVIWSFMSGGMDDLSEKEHGLSCFLWRRLSGKKMTQPNTVALATKKVTTKLRMWWKAPPMVVLPAPSPPVTARHRSSPQLPSDSGCWRFPRSQTLQEAVYVSTDTYSGLATYIAACYRLLDIPASYICDLQELRNAFLSFPSSNNWTWWWPLHKATKEYQNCIVSPNSPLKSQPSILESLSLIKLSLPIKTISPRLCKTASLAGYCNI